MIIQMQSCSSSSSNCILSPATIINAPLSIESPPFPRVHIDHNTLTKPVPVRGTPVTVNQRASESNTPEIRAAAFSPQSSANSAFKPIQSPTLYERSESLTIKSPQRLSGQHHRMTGQHRPHRKYKHRHRVRSFLTNPVTTNRGPRCGSVWTPQLDSSTSTTTQRRCDSACYRRYHSQPDSLHHRFHLDSQDMPDVDCDCDRSSCCGGAGDYSDIDVAEIECN